METRKPYFVDLPGFMILRRKEEKDVVNGKDITRDVSRVCPKRIDLSLVTSIDPVNYTDESSIYYDERGNPFPQEKCSCVVVSYNTERTVIWFYIPFDQLIEIHNQYLKESGIQKEVLSYC